MKWVAQSCPTLCNAMDYIHSPWNSPGQNTGVGSLSLLQGNLPNPGIKPSSPTLQVDSLPAEWATGTPKNTRVGSLSLLQQILPTQESNQGLLHCRQTLYQLSYQGSPKKKMWGSALLRNFSLSCTLHTPAAANKRCSPRMNSRWSARAELLTGASVQEATVQSIGHGIHLLLVCEWLTDSSCFLMLIDSVLIIPPADSRRPYLPGGFLRAI